MENNYTKVFSLKGNYFTKEYEKPKFNKVVKREILEVTVRKHFKNRDCNITIYFEETGKTLLITPDSPRDEVIKYLGEKFASEF